MAKSENVLPARFKITIGILVLIIVGLVAALVVVSVNKSDDRGNLRNSEFSSCPQKTTLKPQYMKSRDLYRDLSEDELIHVRDYILNVASLNVTPFEKATINSNYIFLIELQNPNKDDAIAYLDGNGTKPTRAANVVIFKGAVSPRVVEEILVYFDKPIRHEPYTLLTNRTIPFHARPINKHNLAIRAEIINDFGTKAHHILDKLFGGYVIANCTDRCLTYISLPPRALIPNSKELISFTCFLRGVPGMILQPVGLELLIQGEGNDGSKWKTRVRK
ncbi:amiloride-sensitive amine oxidase [copper-containing]-like [Paramuricea clavata]|uniref:Amiloride-sensitive amine oxidase [copper-containing]-like n=1 Tax=Paramuricea clavata TaxID=317549 RepID=A0A7D9E7M8_PARCT|nr:amiloride-sensitive amine oxidase [copper-containing]-like [Paramuricea clavata]